MTCYSVSQLNERARLALERAFDEDTWVVGEVSGLKNHAKTGHVYFDLVEKSPEGQGQYLAKVSCAFFRGSFLSWQAMLKREAFPSFDLADGLEVKVKARVDLYAKEGRYQLIVSAIDPHYSLGAIARKRALTIETLQKEGLLERNKRLSLSACPLSIGLITSRGSAAYNDFMSILKKSAYAFRITLFDAHMQGERTAAEVVRAIRVLESRSLDAIAVVRGGGAKMDLVAFDDISICRTIANCTCPVITGIGHEIDLSVADMVAFRHFVTPTDVARFLVSRLDDLWARIDEASQALAPSCRQNLSRAQDRLRQNASELAYLTQRQTMHAVGGLYTLAHALTSHTLRRLTQEHAGLSRLRQSLENASRYTQGLQVELIARHRAALPQTIRDILARHAGRLEGLEAYLTLMDPAATLNRGYSITLSEKGHALREAGAVDIGERITTILSQGRISSLVQDKEQV
ncbi:MAG TPA: exodeoxyribonuclease VII large subunit [Deltaproteobacteria bacterium]|nr:exodeoxyribonuclease VII large subunit [Deltaproteobacteria bacterium]